MIFLSEPTMNVDVLAVMKNDHGYTVAIQGTSGTAQLVFEDEDKVLDFVAEVITGRYDVLSKKEPEVEILN
jgi:hypothetical protein